MEEDIKILKEYIENDSSFDFDSDKHIQAIENILNRLEQDEKIINNVASYLEYYYLGNSRYEDSQEAFEKLLKMLKRD